MNKESTILSRHEMHVRMHIKINKKYRNKSATIGNASI